MKVQACMNEGAGVHRPRYRHKGHAMRDVDAGIVGNRRFVAGKAEFDFHLRDPIPLRSAGAISRERERRRSRTDALF